MSLPLFQNKLRGFTIIELMISLVILGGAMVVIFRIISSNISVSTESIYRNQATMLAKEGIEIMYNLRDSNLNKGLDRNCWKVTSDDNGGLECLDVNKFTSGTNLYISQAGSSIRKYSVSKNSSDSQIKLDNHDFTRSIYIDNPNITGGGNGQIYKITSTVSYRIGSQTRDVSISSLIGQTSQE